MRCNFSNAFKVVAGQTSPEDALSAADYPASGSYIDVSGYEEVNVVVHMGAINAGDTPSVEIKVAEAIAGTADVIDATYCKKEVLATDDDQFLVFHVEVAKLVDDHHFLTCQIADVTNGAYGDIVFYLCGARHQPVTQGTDLPSDNRFTWSG